MDVVIADQIGDLLDNHPLNWKRREPTVLDVMEFYRARSLLYRNDEAGALIGIAKVFAKLYNRDLNDILMLDYRYYMHFWKELVNDDYEL